METTRALISVASITGKQTREFVESFPGVFTNRTFIDGEYAGYYYDRITALNLMPDNPYKQTDEAKRMKYINPPENEFNWVNASFGSFGSYTSLFHSEGLRPITGKQILDYNGEHALVERVAIEISALNIQRSLGVYESTREGQLRPLFDIVDYNATVTRGTTGENLGTVEVTYNEQALKDQEVRQFLERCTERSEMLRPEDHMGISQYQALIFQAIGLSVDEINTLVNENRLEKRLSIQTETNPNGRIGIPTIYDLRKEEGMFKNTNHDLVVYRPDA